MEAEFWEFLDILIASKSIVIDRSKGSIHPQFPDLKHPLDYGNLEGTRSMDGSGVDVWVGSESTPKNDGILATIDLQKKDSEIKLVIGCSEKELDVIKRFHDTYQMRAIYIQRNKNGEK